MPQGDYPRDLVGYGRTPARPEAGRAARDRRAVRHQLRGGRREHHPARRRRLRGVPVGDRRRAALAGPAPHEHGVDLRVRLARRLLAAVAAVHRARHARSPSTASPRRMAAQSRGGRRPCRRPAGRSPATASSGSTTRISPKADERAHIREADPHPYRGHRRARRSAGTQGRTSTHTLELVMEEGGFLYSADSYADDLPYWVHGPATGRT